MSIPTLGYPSRTAAIVTLRDRKGLSVEEIGELTGLAPERVRVTLSQAKRRRYRLPPIGAKRRKLVWLDTDALLALQPEAKKRGMTITELVRFLLFTIADEGLADAILDDGDLR